MKLARAIVATLTILGSVAIALLLLPATSFADDLNAAEEQAVAGNASSLDSVHSEAGDLSSFDVTTVVSPQDSNEQQPKIVEDDRPNEPELLDVWYVDERCEPVLAEQCAPIDVTSTSLKSGWYVLAEDVELPSALVIEGDVRIILADGHTLSVPKGVRVNKDSTLTLYGQSELSGSLVVQKGILLWLTEEQKAEADLNYMDEKPQLLFVWPCLDVVAGDHEPRPDDESDPDHAPKHVDTPCLNESLLKKGYLCIQPRVHHEIERVGEFFVCSICDGWFGDADGHVAIEKNEENRKAVSAARALANGTVGSESSETSVATITFDPNGGTGSMEPLQVEAGEAFELPECAFEPPAGKEFLSWSLGSPRSKVSVPTSTTVKAWWKDAVPASTSTDDTDESSDDEDTSESSSITTDQTTQSTSSQDSAFTQDTASGSSSTSSTSATPTMGDATIALNDVAGVLLVCGLVLVLAGKSHLIERR